MEGVPDLRQVRILHGVMTANSGSFTTITYEVYYKLLQHSSFHHDKALSEGSRRSQIKAHEVFTETSQETCDYHPSPQDDPQPTVEEDTLVETYEVHMSNFKPKDNPSRVFISEILWKIFSSEDRKLIIEYNKKIPPKTWSPSSGNTRTLPNAPSISDGGKSRSISCHQGEEEGAHASDNPLNEETSGQDQQLLAMVHETINSPVDHPSSDIDQVLSINRANTRTLKTSYIFTKAKTNLSLHQLIDRRANGGLAGSDMRVLHRTGHRINIVSIDNHELAGLDIQ